MSTGSVHSKIQKVKPQKNKCQAFQNEFEEIKLEAFNQSYKVCRKENSTYAITI